MPQILSLLRNWSPIISGSPGQPTQKQTRTHWIIHTIQKVELLSLILFASSRLESDAWFCHRPDKYLGGNSPGNSFHNEDTDRRYPVLTWKHAVWGLFCLGLFLFPWRCVAVISWLFSNHAFHIWIVSCSLRTKVIESCVKWEKMLTPWTGQLMEESVQAASSRESYKLSCTVTFQLSMLYHEAA